jgi:hypothetical protein
MPKFDGDWRFDSPGEIAHCVISGFSDLIGKIANHADRQSILERKLGANGFPPTIRHNLSKHFMTLARRFRIAILKSSFPTRTGYRGCWPKIRPVIRFKPLDLISRNPQSPNEDRRRRSRRAAQSFNECSRRPSASRLSPSTSDISARAGGSAGWG